MGSSGFESLKGAVGTPICRRVGSPTKNPATSFLGQSGVLCYLQTAFLVWVLCITVVDVVNWV